MNAVLFDEVSYGKLTREQQKAKDRTLRDLDGQKENKREASPNGDVEYVFREVV